MKTAFKLWVGRVVFVLFFLFVFLGLIGYCSKPSMPPSIEDAPWAIQTYSNDEFHIPARIYFAENIEIIEGVPIMSGNWWTYDGKHYHRHSGEKQLTPDEYGPVKVVRR